MKRLAKEISVKVRRPRPCLNEWLLKEVVNKLIPDSMSMDIQKACQGIYPLHDVHIRKVKVLKRPRFDLSKLMELHGEGDYQFREKKQQMMSVLYV